MTAHEQLLKAAKGVDAVVNEIMREASGKGPAANWAIINGGLVALNEAIARSEAEI